MVLPSPSAFCSLKSDQRPCLWTLKGTECHRVTQPEAEGKLELNNLDLHSKPSFFFFDIPIYCSLPDTKLKQGL